MSTIKSRLSFWSWFRNRYLNGFSICFIIQIHFQKIYGYFFHNKRSFQHAKVFTSLRCFCTSRDFFFIKKVTSSQEFSFIKNVFHKQKFFLYQGSFPQAKILPLSRKFSSRKYFPCIKEVFHMQRLFYDHESFQEAKFFFQAKILHPYNAWNTIFKRNIKRNVK